MKANQLRIGNWVFYDRRPFKIYGISKEYPFLDTIEFGVGVVEWKDLQPIELTEEILLSCGFEEKGTIFRINKNTENEFDVCIKLKTKELYFGGTFRSYQINNLHQLQNIVFDLTGEELKIELC